MLRPLKIIHLSAECFPAAKVGGLGDVLGALPKYQNALGFQSSVILPFYDNKFTAAHSFEDIYDGQIRMGPWEFPYTIRRTEAELGFDLYQVNIPGVLISEDVYVPDETKRFLAYQIAALDWLSQPQFRPDIVHCHDHHTGLTPFMMSRSKRFESLRKIPSILTIHNAQYQGWFQYDRLHWIPEFDLEHIGLLDWDGNINPLAAAVKCAWRVTTVSPGYLEELKSAANGIEGLIRMESGKCSGIINGIDTAVWDPGTDPSLVKSYTTRTVQSGKNANRAQLCKEFGLDPDLPLCAFIGRLAWEKGADVLPEACRRWLSDSSGMNLLILGTGDPLVESELTSLNADYAGSCHAVIAYDESLAHRIYAGADFLLMPSRVEPCGLNQLYAMRYGTVPIVSSTGGLADTVIDIDKDGFGICIDAVTPHDIYSAIGRAFLLYNDRKKFSETRKHLMNIDHSWEVSAQQYIELYQNLIT